MELLTCKYITASKIQTHLPKIIMFGCDCARFSKRCAAEFTSSGEDGVKDKVYVYIYKVDVG
jgi:hypothetical protein